MARTTAIPLLMMLAAACGGAAVETRPMAELRPLPEGTPVYLFVREEKIPACPWEVIGSIEANEGWLERQAERDAVAAAALQMGGQAVFAERRDDPEVMVIRFLDPFSLCDPRE